MLNFDTHASVMTMTSAQIERARLGICWKVGARVLRSCSQEKDAGKISWGLEVGEYVVSEVAGGSGSDGGCGGGG